jgi:predicted membrane-bound dolichyl-phosphate-mannose-protein mannosyltransferase
MNIPSLKEFTPLNGYIAIELLQVNEPANIWRIIAIAKNANLEHYKGIKVGDFVYTSSYVYKQAVGTVAYIKPSDIKSIFPSQ